MSKYKTTEPGDSSRRSGVHLDTYAVCRAIPIEEPIIYIERTTFSLVSSADVISVSGSCVLVQVFNGSP